ncbi:MAG: hypothetical protein EBZ24_15460, partial [Synechococcaceae bacterium WB9_4xB_025]|nr:hypothetical protein [Synechococcaceae bacterium WB9_4xB_025]
RIPRMGDGDTEQDQGSQSWPTGAKAPEQMRQLLIVGALALVPQPAAAQPARIQCPGETTPQMVVGCDDRLNRALLKEFIRRTSP